MKKTLVALAALAATSAFAQSTVTIGGIVNYGQAVSTAKQATVGGWKGDRNVLNFAIVEDLGAGNNIGLNLQTRFNAADSGMNTGYKNSSTGAAGDNVFEQSKVTVNTKDYGQLALGRFTNAIGVAALHPLEDAGQSTASHQAVNGRHSGQIQYTTPSFGGAKLFVLSAKASSNKYLGAGTGGGYDSAWDLSAANLATNAGADSRHRDTSAVGVDYTAGNLYVHAYDYKDLLNVHQTKIGATYNFGTFKLWGSQYNQKDNIAYSATAAAATKGMAAHKATEIAVTVPYGAYTATLGRFQADKDLDLAKTDGTTKTQKTGWGLTYDVSKRTQLQYYGSSTTKGSANLNSAGLATGHTHFWGVQHTF